MSLSWNQPFTLSGRWDTTAPAAAQLTGKADASQDAPAENEVQEGPVQRELDARPLWPAHGELHFAADGGLTLDVLGPNDDFFSVHPDGTTIYGVTTEGALCSLLDSRGRSIDGSLGGYARHTFAGRLLVHGAHIAAADELPIERAEIELRGLREALWHPEVGPLGMKEVDEDCHELTVEVSGARVTFRLGWEGVHKVHERHTERAADVVVELDEAVPFDSLFDRWVLPLLDFVALATREPTRVEAVTAVLTREAPALWWKPDAPRTDEEHRVEFVRLQDPLVADSRFGFRRPLFFIGELPDPGAALARWLALHSDLRPSARFIFTALNSRMYVEHRLANLTSAAEGYHRAKHDEPPLAAERFDALVEGMLAACESKAERDHFEVRLKYANSQGQRARLQWLYRRVENLLSPLAARRSSDIGGLVETRNYFTHQDEKNAGVLDGQRLSLALHRLEAVVQGNILLDLGLGEDWVSAALQWSYDGHPAMR